MPVTTASANESAVSVLLETMERDTVSTFKDRDEAAFVRHFADDYIGVANDGVKIAADEVRGMHAFDVRRIRVEDLKVSFPALGVGIVTYTMAVSGSRRGVAFDVSIFTATVYVVRDGAWQAALHTESRAAP